MAWDTSLLNLQIVNLNQVHVTQFETCVSKMSQSHVTWVPVSIECAEGQQGKNTDEYTSG